MKLTIDTDKLMGTEEEQEQSDDVRDVTGRFLEEQRYPANLDVKVLESHSIENRLNKLGSFLKNLRLSKEYKKVVDLEKYLKKINH
jgi:hypothetical protein